MGLGAILMMDSWPYNLQVADAECGYGYAIWHQDDTHGKDGYGGWTNPHSLNSCDHDDPMFSDISARLAPSNIMICRDIPFMY